MTNPKMLDEVVDKLKEAFAQSPVKDIEKNVKAVLQGALSRLDVVTREEFDVQAQVLLRTREKLSALELRMDELEAKIDALHKAGGGAGAA
ncbi:MAG: accessory factor UbiK family protein [Betaproteobacteria bacterium]|nr:accessory factor UbiK family protein [Betaproteobacteria bacterium]